MAGVARDAGEETVFLCLEASDLLLEPMCSTWELQQELVPYVLSHSLQHEDFLKLPKAERQAKVKILTQRILSGGETGAPSGDEEESPGQLRRFGFELSVAYLRPLQRTSCSSTALVLISVPSPLLRG
ncbi:unnamed protein product [Durusdinium trenchii]|uniref:Uncharacterized protein n=1 Tax=Durusdinium trenchii TaxID=1381693 RepID=A0ABP0NKC0_9DINO